MKPFRFSMLLAAVLLVSCGDGDEDSIQASDPPAGPPARGALVAGSPSKRASFSPQQLLALVATDTANPVAAALSLAPRCSIDVYDLKYGTVGARAEAVTASGALMIPTGTDPTCQGPRPILLYAHGTTTNRAATMADLNDPDNNEGVLMAAVFAGNGYIVVAPDYAGYGDTTLPYHAYLNADQQSKDMIDALAATRAGLPNLGAAVTDGAKLFITGYSQGGYVAMATHRAMQDAGATVTASAPMSGPYALSAFGDAIFQGRVSGSSPVNLTLLISGYQKAYLDIFANTTDVFEARYATGIDSLLPSTTPLAELEAQGRLPADQLFSSTPPAPQFAAITPATEPPELAPAFARGFGPDNLITNAYRLSYLQDAQASPDGGFPVVTDGLPPLNPTHALRRALKTNDLRNWTPTSPVQLCGGSGDPTVFYFNTQLMQSFWAANAPPATIAVLDVESDGAFVAARELLRLASGDDAVLESYHAGLVPPFCLAAVKSFFDAR
jgi:poly(3-hydroxybutyrate) depolymerase